MAFEIGKIAGGYEFLDVLDSTKTGVAYKVRNLKFNRLEMLRILPRTVQDDQERVARFLREGKVHARLSHPNIITYYHASASAAELVMTTELVEGTQLAWRRACAGLRPPDAVRYVRHVS